METHVKIIFLIAALSAQQGDLEPHNEPSIITALAGTWQCSGKFVRSGRPIASAIRIELGGPARTLLVRHDDRAPNDYHALELWSFGGGTGRATIADGTDMRWFDLVATSTTVTLDRKDAKGAVESFAYKLVDDHLAVEWRHRDATGALVVGDTLDCSR